VKSSTRAGGGGGPADIPPGELSGLLDVAGAATYLGVTQPFVRRLVLERRVRYYKLGKFVRFRVVDLDAFVEAGRHEPVAPWVHPRSTAQRSSARTSVQNGSQRTGVAATSRKPRNVAGG
jgi:excisionase family DNA binding protein